MRPSIFIKSKIEDGYSKEEIRGMYDEFLSLRESNESIPTYLSFAREVRRAYLELKAEEYIDTNWSMLEDGNREAYGKAAELHRQKQMSMDQLRVERKINRETERVQSAVMLFNQELISEIPKIKIDTKVEKLKNNSESLFGILQLSDHHFNELIHDDEVGNSFDFDIGAKRLKKLVDEADRVFKAYGITKIFIAFLGDLINSDRRLDEILHASTNRARATLLACHIYRQMIEDFIKKGYTLHVSAVTGNESRAGEFNNFSDISATDNYDFTIYNILKIMFEKEKKATFVHGDWKESVVALSGINVLLLHGESVKAERDIRDLYSKWANKGVLIDYILHGHYHSTMISDLSSRSSSLCGANAYSDKQLNLYGKASQNVHIIMKDKAIHSFKFDLQNVDGATGYAIVDELMEYNSKSARKLNQKQTVLEVKI